MILPTIIIVLWFWAITATWLAFLWKARLNKQGNKGNYMTALLAIIMVSMAFLALSHP